MQNIFMLIAMLVVSALAAAQDTCHGHLKYGLPSQADKVLCRQGYALGYNFSRKSADWVAYRLTPAIHNSANVERQNDSRIDTDIPAIYQTTPDDYDEPIYDQGHLANSESLDASIQMNSETFLLTNMSPQLPGLNRAGWKGLENRERKWTDQRGELYIYSGAMFVGGVKAIIGNGVPVPTHYYKILFDPARNEAIAFLFPHTDIKTSELNGFLTSIDTIELLTGLNFLSVLPDVEEEQIERVKLVNQW